MPAGLAVYQNRKRDDQALTRWPHGLQQHSVGSAIIGEIDGALRHEPRALRGSRPGEWPEARKQRQGYEAADMTHRLMSHLTTALELRAPCRQQRIDWFHFGLPDHQSVDGALAMMARQLQALVRPLPHRRSRHTVFGTGRSAAVHCSDTVLGGWPKSDHVKITAAESPSSAQT